LIIYNRDAFKAAGVPEPPTQWNDPNWNWDIFLDYAQKLTKRQGNVTTQWGIVGLTGTTAEALWPGNITGTGLFGVDGKTAAVCSPEARPGVQYLVDTLLKYKVHPLFGETAQAQNLFISGQAAMIIDGSQAFATFRSSCTFDWDVAPVPMKRYGKTLPGLMVYGVPKKTKNSDLAAKFLFFLGEEFAQQKFAEGGNIPINKEYAAKFYPRPGMKPSRQQTVLEGANWFIVNNLNPKTDEARRAYRQYLHQAYAGEISVDDAMAKAKIDIDAIFGRP
jgi:multiple sugar transport system substrate-binding protein